MFRKDGAGELYLYAPREKQVDALCELGPLSYCNSVYGMSIGRGSWTFKTGQWTDVRQDVWLNTPGKADGGFNIWSVLFLSLSLSLSLFTPAAGADDECALLQDQRRARPVVVRGLLPQLGGRPDRHGPVQQHARPPHRLRRAPRHGLDPERRLQARQRHGRLPPLVRHQGRRPDRDGDRAAVRGRQRRHHGNELAVRLGGAQAAPPQLGRARDADAGAARARHAEAGRRPRQARRRGRDDCTRVPRRHVPDLLRRLLDRLRASSLSLSLSSSPFLSDPASPHRTRRRCSTRTSAASRCASTAEPSVCTRARRRREPCGSRASRAAAVLVLDTLLRPVHSALCESLLYHCRFAISSLWVSPFWRGSEVRAPAESPLLLPSPTAKSRRCQRFEQLARQQGDSKLASESLESVIEDRNARRCTARPTCALPRRRALPARSSPHHGYAKSSSVPSSTLPYRPSSSAAAPPLEPPFRSFGSRTSRKRVQRLCVSPRAAAAAPQMGG